MFISHLLLAIATTLDPSGHWEGAIRTPAAEVAVAVDLTKKESGELAGTFTNAARNVHAFPLSTVAIDGTSLTFAINATGGGAFRSTVAADGKSMKGTFSTKTPDGEQIELPFELTRTGDAKVVVVPKSPAVTKQLEGKWTGTIDVEGTTRRVGLDIVNHADGTATGSIITDEGVAVAMTRIAQNGSSVTLDVTNVGGSYAGTINGDGELVGTWKQGAFEAPVTFRRK